MRFLWTGGGLLGLVLVFGSPLHADRADNLRAIIQRAVKAVGGAENLGKWNASTWKTKGTVYATGEIAYTGDWTVAWPDRIRSTSESRVNGQRFVVVRVYDRGKAWVKNNDTIREAEDGLLSEFKEQVHAAWVAHLLPLLQDDRYTLTALGDAKVGDRPAVGVKVSRKDYRDVALYFDTETGLLARSVVRVRDVDGQEYDQETFYRGYKAVGPVKLATRIIIYRDGKPYVDSEASDFQRLDKVDDKLFKKP